MQRLAGGLGTSQDAVNGATGVRTGKPHQPRQANPNLVCAKCRLRELLASFSLETAQALVRPWSSGAVSGRPFLL